MDENQADNRSLKVTVQGLDLMAHSLHIHTYIHTYNCSRKICHIVVCTIYFSSLYGWLLVQGSPLCISECSLQYWLFANFRLHYNTANDTSLTDEQWCEGCGRLFWGYLSAYRFTAATPSPQALPRIKCISFSECVLVHFKHRLNKTILTLKEQHLTVCTVNVWCQPTLTINMTAVCSVHRGRW
jgi:hypothetical protein